MAGQAYIADSSLWPQFPLGGFSSRKLAPVTPSLFLALRPRGVTAQVPPLALPTPVLFNPFECAFFSCQECDKSSEMVQERESEFTVLPEAKCYVQSPAMSIGTVARVGLILEHAACSVGSTLTFWEEVCPSSGQTVYILTFEFLSVLLFSNFLVPARSSPHLAQIHIR